MSIENRVFKFRQVRQLTQLTQILSLVLLSTASIAAERCEFTNAPVKLESKRQSALLWEEKNSPVFWSDQLPESKTYQHYRDLLLEKYDSDPYKRIEKLCLGRVTRPIWEQVERRCRKLISKEIGKIRPISCLEALLVTAHTERYPLEKNSTEFLSYILERRGDLRVYYFTDSLLGGGGDDETVKTAVADGWNGVFVMHNHPLFLDEPGLPISGDLGFSDADVSYYLKMFPTLNLQWVSTTNGLDTLDMTLDELKRYRDT